MYSSIRIRGYRGLDSLEIQGLGRLNLLVGTNSCGKTSILECIELLRSAGNCHVLSSIAERRGERSSAGEGVARGALASSSDFFDVSHLFPNREFQNKIQIEADCSGDTADWNDKVTVYIEEQSLRQQHALDVEVVDDDEPLHLHVKWADAACRYRARSTEDGLLFQSHRFMRNPGVSEQAAQFVMTSGMTAGAVAHTFSKFVFTPKHEAIKQALRIVEPTVEDLAPVTGERTRFRHNTPGGVVLKLDGVVERVPIGRMGDGMWRMLGLALSIANADGGVLLVDEIDSGLHYSVMVDMWRMLSKVAHDSSVQVFATTHSRDCYESLAAISTSASGGVTIQRVDPSKGKAVRYSPQAIVAAADRNIEVR